MPTTVLVQFSTQPGKRPALIDFLKGVQPGAIGAGCHSIAIHSDVDDENKAFEVEYWDDKASHQAFVSAAAAAGAFAPFDDLLAEPFVVTYGTPALKTER